MFGKLLKIRLENLNVFVLLISHFLEMKKIPKNAENEKFSIIKEIYELKISVKNFYFNITLLILMTLIHAIDIK